MTQRVEFPRPALDRELVTQQVNLSWLSETLEGQEIRKPSEQFEFFFDPRGLRGPAVDVVRDVFELWAEYELPQLGIPVEKGEES